MIDDEKTPAEPEQSAGSPPPGQEQSHCQAEAPDRRAAVSRRVVVAGAIGASSILTIRPALAQTVSSVMNCSVPVPDPQRADQSIALDGSLVPPGTSGAFPPPGRPFTAAEVRSGLSTGQLPGVNYDAGQAYLNYIRRLQTGQAGYSCYASLRFRN